MKNEVRKWFISKGKTIISIAGGVEPPLTYGELTFLGKAEERFTFNEKFFDLSVNIDVDNSLLFSKKEVKEIIEIKPKPYLLSSGVNKHSVSFTKSQLQYIIDTMGDGQVLTIENKFK